MPIDVGVFGLADGGRVFLDGEDSNSGTPASGAASRSPSCGREYTFSIAAAKGSDDDKVRVYFQGGYGF